MCVMENIIIAFSVRIPDLAKNCWVYNCYVGEVLSIHLNYYYLFCKTYHISFYLNNITQYRSMVYFCTSKYRRPNIFKTLAIFIIQFYGIMRTITYHHFIINIYYNWLPTSSVARCGALSVFRTIRQILFNGPHTIISFNPLKRCLSELEDSQCSFTYQSQEFWNPCLTLPKLIAKRKYVFLNFRKKTHANAFHLGSL